MSGVVADYEKSAADMGKRVDSVMKRMPLAFRATVAMVPRNMRLPVLCAVMPLAACYAYGATARYWDNNVHHLGLMSIVVGPQASGKSFCTHVVRYWEQQLEREDAAAREIEDNWKESVRRKASTDKSEADPKALIRMLPITTSNAELLTRLKRCRGNCLWSFGEELDTLRKNNKSGSWAEKYDVFRMAFDYGLWGQDYKSMESESGLVNVSYNWTCLGTYGALRKCFNESNVENGLSSRIMFAEMPDSWFREPPIFNPPSDADLRAIDDAVTRLRSAKGLVDAPRLRRAMRKWCDERTARASLDDDKVAFVYMKRAAVMGFRCGIIAMLLEGRESNSVLDFARLIADYVCYEQCRLFGAVLQKTISENEALALGGNRSENKSIYAKLPATFTLDDLARLKGADTSRNTIMQIVSRWKRNNWISKTGSNQWEKLLKE